MDRWPAVDPAERRRLLRELRRRQASEDAACTPDQRLSKAEQLRSFAESFGHGCGADEPPELWLAMLRRFREAGRRRSE